MFITAMKVMKNNNPWRWWAKAIGEKASKCDKESDIVATIRTVIFATYLLTNCFIVAGVIRHWNDQGSASEVTVTCLPPYTPVPATMKTTNRTGEFE